MWMLAGASVAATLVAQPPARLAAAVYVDGRTVTGHVDRRFFGLFSEHLGDALDWRLAAQKLRNRGFEAGDRDHKGVGDSWAPVGSGEFALDPTTSFPRFADGRSSTSQRITLAASGRAGIVQRDLAVTKSDALTVSLYVKAAPGIRQLLVALVRPPATGADPRDPDSWPTLASADIADVPRSWEKRVVTLEPMETVFPCGLLLLAEGQGAVWLDQTSAEPASQFAGWRGAVVGLYEWLKPGTLRYPGGNFCQTYHFPDGIGPVDGRPVVPSPAWGNYPEPNNIGTDEFLRLCERVRMEPVICLNIGDTGGKNTLPDNSSERALRESLEWLEYCNGDADRTEWGRKRAANGHPAPYGVRLWEVGNEIGYSHIHGQLNAEQYVERFLDFAPKLRAADPTIELIACGHDPAWTKLVAERSGDLARFVSVHTYDFDAHPEDFMVHPALIVPGLLDSQIAAIRGAGRGPDSLRIALNEWSYSWSRWGDIAGAVAATGLLQECLKRADWVAMTNSSDSLCRFRTTEADTFPDPECLAIALLAHHSGGEVLRCESEGPAMLSNTRGSAPAVSVSATRAGDRVMVTLANRRAETVTVRLTLDGFGGKVQGATATGIRETYRGARVTAATPSAVSLADLPAPGDGPEVPYDVPPVSVTVLEFTVGEPVAARAGRVTGRVTLDGRPAAGALVTLVPAASGEPVRATTDERGDYAVEVPAGAYQLTAARADAEISAGTPIAVATGSETRSNHDLHALDRADLWEDFSGPTLDPAKWTVTSFEGESGALTVQGSAAAVTSRPNSRFGLLSAPIEVADDRGLVIEARVREFSGINALLHLTTEGHEGQFEQFLELGVERSRAQVWGHGFACTARRIEAPTTLRIVLGPKTPSGRTAELYVGGELVQRARDLGWLSGRKPRFFLYGWGEGTRVWDWVRVRRLDPARRELVFAEDFAGTDVPARWTADAVVGAAGTMSVGDGRLTIQGARESRYGVVTEPLAQGPDEVLVVTAKLAEYSGLNGLMTLLGGGPGDFTGYFEVGLQSGRAQAWVGDWYRTGPETRAPATLRLVAGPPRPDGTRFVRAYVNDVLLSEAPHLAEQSRPLRLFLYGWSDGRSVWDDVRVERVNIGPLRGTMEWPEGAVG